jgi:hypothetical protein
MAEHDLVGMQSTRNERAIFLLLICYLVEEVVRPLLSTLARSFHLPATGPRLRP